MVLGWIDGGDGDGDGAGLGLGLVGCGPGWKSHIGTNTHVGLGHNAVPQALHPALVWPCVQPVCSQCALCTRVDAHADAHICIRMSRHMPRHMPRHIAILQAYRVRAL